MPSEPALIERFRTDLDALIPPHSRIGIAISGGPDSLALLLLAAAVRPAQIEAATVDHGLRPAARDEAAMVADLCSKLHVPHTILSARWNSIPTTAIQERARRERYRLLGYWAEERALEALVTGHHADDQSETFVMRLNRGAGVRGLAGMRRRSVTPGNHMRLLRPLLGWSRLELERICNDHGLTPARDPTNVDERFERARVRRSLREAGWLDVEAISRSAANLAEADAALDWAVKVEWDRAVHEHRTSIAYRPTDAPPEILRRIVRRAVRKLANEGDTELRGAEIDRLLVTLREAGRATLRGVLCEGGRDWRFSQAPARKT